MIAMLNFQHYSFKCHNTLKITQMWWFDDQETLIIVSVVLLQTVFLCKLYIFTPKFVYQEHSKLTIFFFTN